MSIIHDALKKTQRAFSKRENTIPTSDEIVMAHHHAPTHLRYQRTLFFIIAAGVLAFCLLTWHTFLLSWFHPRPVAPVVPVTVKQVIPPAKKPVIILNGTLQSDHARAALINHELYRIGDRIDGYQIKQINYNSVVLLDPNTHHTRLITLTLHS